MRVAVALVCLIAFANDATADGIDPADKAKAEEMAAAARRRISDANDFAGAAELFLAAYERTKELPYLINVAVAQRKARLPHYAVATYRRCLEEGGAALTPELRAQIVADIDHVTQESVQVRVTTAGAAASIELEDRIVGVATKQTPLVVLVAPEAGRAHKLRASRDGFIPNERKLSQLRAGEIVELELEPLHIVTTGTVRVLSKPDAAQVTVAGRGPIGAAPQTIELPAGEYYLHGALPGYRDASERLSVIAGREHQLVLELHKLPPSWWQKNKLAVFIAAGAVAAAGAAVGTYFLIKPDYDGTVIHY